MEFAGRWFTSFGPMILQQDGRRVRGTYGANGTENVIEGALAEDGLTFRYQEALEQGTGWFRLKRHGSFAGEYLAQGHPHALPWQGWREFEGYWETTLGRMRLFQEADRVHGFLEFDGAGRLEGRVDRQRLTYTFKGSHVSSNGFLDLDPLCHTLGGEWQEQSHPVQVWRAQRAPARRGLIWLVVLEAHWQRSLDDTEYAFGSMLREIFGRLPRAQVRHRFFHDEESLVHWCRQIMFLPEPAILVVTGHGETDGLTVNGRIIDMRRMIDSLRLADSLQLLHFSSCLVGQNTGQALTGAPFAISGYTTRVDWAESALTEFIYLDMILEKGLPPARAAEQLVSLVRFAGDETIPGSPYLPAGFRFLGPAGAPAQPVAMA
ncbi:MAG: hypothetical protein K2X43_09125 [Hyphomonadaceae bacterium]|jgi:hypothetical protein|nr:hypothetical protein [Hyphomonadaceae bacterium]